MAKPGTGVGIGIACSVFSILLATYLSECAAVVQKDKGDSADRQKAVKNLRDLGLAMHNFHAAFESLPRRAFYSKAGKPLLSWRVALLPFLDQQELYRQFKIDEPWDSEHNKKLLSKMPEVYVLPGAKTKEPFTTFYRVFVGNGALFEDDSTARMSFGQLSTEDGTNNTILMVESGEAVPWTKPDELAYDPSKPLPRLEGRFKDGFHILMCTGQVRFVEKGFNERVFRAAITRNGGEDIGLPGKDVEAKPR